MTVATMAPVEVPTTKAAGLRFQNVAQWKIELSASYQRYKDASWELLLVLRTGLDQFGRTDHAKSVLYGEAASALGLQPKTVQNWVSASRKPSTSVAINLGLELGHAVAVLGLPHEQAVDVLTTAAEQGLSVEATRYEAHMRKGADQGGEEWDDTFPDNGKSVEPAYTTRYMYEDQDRMLPVTCPHCGRKISDHD